MTQRFLILCALLALGPPAALMAYHHKTWLREPSPINPGTAHGQLLVFTADWCGACRHMKPVVAELYREGFDVQTLNVDKNRDKAQQYGVRAIPTFVLVRDGKEVRRQSGVTSAEKLKQIWR
jgi:thiol-disulfide isomerase/thioredoxin